MAPRTKKHSKTTAKKKNSTIGCLFWIGFFIIIAGLFLVNRELIQKTLTNTQFFERLFNKPPSETKPTITPEQPVPSVTDETTSTKPLESPDRLKITPEPTTSPSEKSNQVPTNPQQPITKPEKEVNPQSQTKMPKEKQIPQPQTRNQVLYFMQIDADGSIIREKTQRTIPVSDTPLMDTIAQLLNGPTTTEKQKGLVSMIPAGTRLLSATVRGNTAYLNFSEEFLFNTYGIEGYAAQLKQIVWTATEFPNISDVQILIEGKRIDYLGAEGVWIGSPLTRDSL